MPIERLLTKIEAAQALHISAYTVGQLIRTGQLSAVAVTGQTLKRRYFVTESALGEFMTKNTSQPQPVPATSSPPKPVRRTAATRSARQAIAAKIGG